MNLTEGIRLYRQLKPTYLELDFELDFCNGPLTHSVLYEREWAFSLLIDDPRVSISDVQNAHAVLKMAHKRRWRDHPWRARLVSRFLALERARQLSSALKPLTPEPKQPPPPRPAVHSTRPSNPGSSVVNRYIGIVAKR
jgi:hypothetical protein